MIAAVSRSVLRSRAVESRFRADAARRVLLIRLHALGDVALVLPAAPNVAGKTTAGEAFAVLLHAAVIVSEDSGLMHMAWAAGVPVVALLGSTRSDWSAPQGDRAACLDSADLGCGCCVEPACRFGDVHCLRRRAPNGVLDSALALLARIHTQSLEQHS